MIGAFEKPLQRASWIERIEFQAASRQFDPVLTEVVGKLKDPSHVAISPMDLERAARIALSVAVRVKQDPDRAAFLAQAVIDSPNASFATKEAARAWLKDIKVWQGEKARKYASDKDVMAAARVLLKKKGEVDEPVLGDHSEVKFLRASLLMHDLLRGHPQSPYTAEALYTIGRSYESLRDLGLWSLHEMYYLACINKVPHTALSERCYKNYEESVTLGYTGSSGVHLPAAVRKHLSDVKATATVSAAKK
ncbi:MAG: hypothetical protein HC902_12860 [Calothrix sp. SM1_5_4]|nr:hypothetical protein [Calothrix sp. SM1_5_4]